MCGDSPKSIENTANDGDKDVRLVKKTQHRETDRTWVTSHGLDNWPVHHRNSPCFLETLYGCCHFCKICLAILHFGILKQLKETRQQTCQRNEQTIDTIDTFQIGFNHTIQGAS